MSEWTSEMIERLRILWDEGHSTQQIANRMGVSKNSIVGKAHRLDLVSRPSPILERGSGAKPKRQVIRGGIVAGSTLPPLSSASLRPIAVRPIALPKHEPEVVRFTRKLTPCCWPIGTPGTRNFHFCDAASVPSKPYCVEHARIAYVKRPVTERHFTPQPGALNFQAGT
jgi:GcrA cell cycle regulator